MLVVVYKPLGKTTKAVGQSSWNGQEKERLASVLYSRISFFHFA